MLDPGTKPQEHPFLFQEGLARARSDDRHFSSWEDMNRASRARRTAQNYANHVGEDDHSSGFCSPPLWKTSPSSSPPHERSHYRSLSPASKSQAIARGQRELMDMVKNMPESCYELSLRDLVEQPAMLNQTNQTTEQDSQRDYQKKRRNVMNNNSKKQGQGLRRSGTMENHHNGGFLLKMVFPVSFWSKKKKNTLKKNESLASNSSAKVSPKPALVSGEGSRGEDKEWWKKKFSVTPGDNSETDQSSSINSGSMKSSISSSRSSSRGSTRQGSGGCWWFMSKRKSKNAE